MTFKTRLMQTKRVPAGSGVGYGHTFVTPRESMIGVLPWVTLTVTAADFSTAAKS